MRCDAVRSNGGEGVKVKLNEGDFVSWGGFKGIRVNRVKARLIVSGIGVGIEEEVDEFEFGFNF